MNDQAVVKQEAQEVQVPMNVSAGALEAAIGGNDLSKLSSAEKMKLLAAICHSTGLNPLTMPFAIMKIDGKDTLYAKSEAASQLRKLHKVKIQIVERKIDHQCVIVVAKAILPDGTEDESVGAVSLVYPAFEWEWINGQRQRKAHPQAGKELVGLEYANAIMKAETKAKRRVTLSVCGLGFVDESELEDLRHARASEVITQENETGRSETLGKLLTETAGESTIINLPPAQNTPQASAIPAAAGAGGSVSPAEQHPAGREAAQQTPDRSQPEPQPPSSSWDPGKGTLFDTPAKEPKPEPQQQQPPPPTAAPPPAPAAQPAPSPATAQPAKAEPFANADGTLTDATVERIGKKFDEMGDTAANAVPYLIAKGKLKKGAALNTIDHTAAKYILDRPLPSFIKLVADWAKTQPKAS